MTLVREKVRQAVDILKETGIECWLTFVRESAVTPDPILDFVAGVPVTWHSAFLITARGHTAAVVGRYDRKAVEDIGAYHEILEYVEGGREPIVALLRRLNPATIAVNFSVSSEVCDGLTHGMYLTLMEWLTPEGLAERLVSAEPIISALRARKTPAELASLRKAITGAEEIFKSAWHFMRPGVSEAAIAGHMHAAAEKKGVALAWGRGTCPAVFAGPDTAEAHYHPTERLLREGHVVSIDFGIKVDGYCSDLQRTHYVMRRDETAVPLEVAHGFATIINSIERARLAMRPGVTGKEIDAIARRFIVEQGYGEFPHALGHQVGRFAHDGTALLGPPWEKYGTKVVQPLEPGMVFTIEPRLTVPGYGIVTVEEMVVVQKDGAEFLSAPQKQLRLVNARPARLKAARPRTRRHAKKTAAGGRSIRRGTRRAQGSS